MQGSSHQGCPRTVACKPRGVCLKTAVPLVFEFTHLQIIGTHLECGVAVSLQPLPVHLCCDKQYRFALEVIFQFGNQSSQIICSRIGTVQGWPLIHNHNDQIRQYPLDICTICPSVIEFNMIGMNDLDCVMGQVKREIDSTQSRISLFYDNLPPPLQMQNSPHNNYAHSQPTYSTVICPPTYVTNYSYQQLGHRHPEQVSGYGTNKDFQKSQQRRVLPRIKLTTQNNQTDPNEIKVKATQAEIIRRQVELRHLVKQKEGYEQFLQDSAIIHNQIANFPFGRSHHALMDKIISQKCVNDYNNEKTLLRFQKEAEEFKKSKSKHLKYLQSTLYRQQSLDNKLAPVQQMLDNPQQSEFQSVSLGDRHISVDLHPATVQETREVPRKRSLIAVQTQKSQFVSTKNNSFDLFGHPLISTRDPDSTKKTLVPITDDGQDGLKLIRKKLNGRVRPMPKTHRKQQTQLDEDSDQNSDSANQIKSVLKDISQILQSNKSIKSRHRRVKTYELEDQTDFYPQSRTRQLERGSIDSNNHGVRSQPKYPKVKLNLSKLKSYRTTQPDIRETKKRLLELSEIFD